MEITCRKALEMIGEYIDVEIPGNVVPELDDHLGECTHCEEFLRQILKILKIVHTTRENEIPEHIKNKLNECLNDEMNITKGPFNNDY